MADPTPALELVSSSIAAKDRLLKRCNKTERGDFRTTSESDMVSILHVRYHEIPSDRCPVLTYLQLPLHSANNLDVWYQPGDALS